VRRASVAIQVTTLLDVTGVRHNDGVRNTQKTFSNDSSHLKGIEMFLPYFPRIRRNAFRISPPQSHRRNIAFTSAAMKKKFHPASRIFVI
jgi:hypothetical protein